MKNSQKGFVVPLLIAIIAVLFIGGGLYYYTKGPNKPINSFIVTNPNGGEKLAIGNTYKITWQNNSGKAPKAIAVQTISQDGKDYGYANIITSNIPSATTGSVDWKIPLNLDPKNSYKLVIFGDKREILGQSENYFSITGEQITSPITSATTFEFHKPFTISGNPLLGNSLAPLYTSDKILQKSLVTARAYHFYTDACEASGGGNCPLKGEQMVRIDLSVAVRVGASWSEKTIYLTDKTQKRVDYWGYVISLISIDAQKKEATIIIDQLQPTFLDHSPTSKS
jgi:hypothetical protein